MMNTYIATSNFVIGQQSFNFIKKQKFLKAVINS